MKYQKKLHASERWPLPSLLNFTRSWPCFSSTGVECAPECNLTTLKNFFYLAPYTYWHIIFPSGACNSRLPWKGGPFSQKRFHSWEVSQSQNEKKRTQSKGHINLISLCVCRKLFLSGKNILPSPVTLDILRPAGFNEKQYSSSSWTLALPPSLPPLTPQPSGLSPNTPSAKTVHCSFLPLFFTQKIFSFFPLPPSGVSRLVSC